ncbi:MAG: hypothetical protein K5780_05535, partial [Alphaproteobacteria bacterium]|nr:hypothetical protein [Alphaproteobacteria bacterium]
FAAELAVMSSLKHSIIFLILYLLNLLYFMPFTLHLFQDDGLEPYFLNIARYAFIIIGINLRTK